MKDNIDDTHVDSTSVESFVRWEYISKSTNSHRELDRCTTRFSVRSELPKIPSGARVTPVWHRTCGNTNIMSTLLFKTCQACQCLSFVKKCQLISLP